MNSKICPLCNSDNTKQFFIKKLITDNDYYSNFNGLDFAHFKCNTCDFVFLPKPADLELEKYYESEYYQSCDYSQQVKQLEKLFAYRVGEIRPYVKGKKILDIGCALGFSLKVYSDMNFDAYGMEVSKSAVTAAKQYTRFDVVQQSIEEPTPWLNDFFDAITMFDILEHTSQPQTALKEVYRILRRNGVIYISTLNFDGIGRKLDTLNWPLLSPPGHMSYFSRKTLLYILRSLGFSIIKTRCFGIASNKSSLQRINSLMVRKFPKIGKLFELTNLGDYVDVIAVKR